MPKTAEISPGCPGWIKSADELPPCHHRVLICGWDGDYFHSPFVAFLDESKYFTDGDHHFCKEASQYWMPLPKPPSKPKGES